MTKQCSAIAKDSCPQKAWKGAIKKLTEYCESRGWAVKIAPGSIDQAWFDQKKMIELNSRHKPELLYYTFLHELGHMHILIDTPDNQYLDIFRTLQSAREKKKYGTLAYRVGIVEEEIAAWRIGYEFAIDRGMPINPDIFDRYKSRMLAGYMRWVNLNFRKKKLMAVSNVINGLQNASHPIDNVLQDT